MRVSKLLLAAASLQMVLPAVALAEDVTLGHVSLPKGKYVLTNTQTKSTIVILVDEDGVVKGPKAETTAATHAVPTATPPAASTATAAAAPAAASTGSSSVVKKLVVDKAKSEAMKALSGKQMQGLMKKVGADKVISP